MEQPNKCNLSLSLLPLLGIPQCGLRSHNLLAAKIAELWEISLDEVGRTTNRLNLKFLTTLMVLIILFENDKSKIFSLVEEHINL